MYKDARKLTTRRNERFFGFNDEHLTLFTLRSINRNAEPNNAGLPDKCFG